MAEAEKTRGSVLFRAAPGSLTAKAEKLGVAMPTASVWASGKRLPDAASRTLIERKFKVPIAAWDLSADEMAPSDDEDDVEEATMMPEVMQGRGGARVQTLAMVDALVGQLERELRGRLTSAARARTSDSLTRALSTRARIEREAATFESEVIRRAPFYRRMKKALISALVPFPDAARAVAGAFTSIDDNDDGAQQGALDEEDEEA